MSLALFKDRLDAGDVEPAVRSHLRGCDECRAYYDQLALAARALGDDGAKAEQARLLASLAPAAKAPPSRLRWAVAAAAAVLIINGAILLLLPKPAGDVTLRGGSAAEAPAWSLRVYGKDAPGERIRLLADFPLAKEASVGVRSELQYFVKPPPPAGFELHVRTKSAQRTTTAKAVGPSAEEVLAVGAPFPAGSLGPGGTEVCVLLTSKRAETYDDAVAAGAAPQCSTLWVSP